MNHRAGWMLVQSTWLSWMEQRSFFFILAVGWMLSPLVYLFVWSTAAGSESVGGLTRDEFIVYYLVFILVSQFTFSIAHWTLGYSILYGGFNQILLYPMAPIYHTLSSEVAGKVVIFTFALPLSAILWLLLRPEVSISLQQALLFIPALGLAWALRFLWGYWMALLAFWTDKGDGLLGIQEALIFVLAGQVAPIALLPGPLQTVATLLPFRYMISFPIEVLTGQATGAALTTGFALQAAWLFVSWGLYRVVLSRGLRRYAAVGG